MSNKLKLLIVSTLGFIAAALAPTAWGFEIVGTETEAEIVPPSPIIQLEFNAVLDNNGFGDLAGVDVVVTWAQVGGIEPIPFRLLIPAGCFVANRGFHVDDFRTCGVELTVDLGRGGGLLTILDFEARVFPLSDGTTRFAVLTSFADEGREPAILGILGGAGVEIFIGSDSAISLPRSIESVGGSTPDDS